MIYVALTLITLHSPAGQEIHINPFYVSSLRSSVRPAGDDDRLYTDRANCLVGMLDGKNISVSESCTAVREMIERAER